MQPTKLPDLPPNLDPELAVWMLNLINHVVTERAVWLRERCAADFKAGLAALQHVLLEHFAAMLQEVQANIVNRLADDTRAGDWWKGESPGEESE